MSESSKIVKVGVLGLGRSGYGIHIDGIKQMPKTFKVVTIYDPLQDRAAAVASELGIIQSTSEAQLLNNPDVELVVVASPNGFHTEQAERALKSGKHVLCEKPFGLTTADSDKIISAAQSAGKLIQPFQQRRYEPDFLKVKEICESGLLGEIYQIRICWHGFSRRWDWQTVRSCAGGALNNNGPHLIDHAIELFGKGEPEVRAETKRCLCSGDAEDHLKAVFYGAGHPTIEIELSSVFAYPQDRWLVCGSKGGLRGGASTLEWKWVDFSAMPERKVELASTPDRSYNSEKLAWQEDSWQADSTADAGSGAAPAVKQVLTLYRSLYRSIREGLPQEITPESVRQRVAVMEKIRKSAGIPAK
ncbi:MAG: Gfo/Idh/MocA family oxidoreductase [Lentisphaerota bacterium]